MPTPRPPLPAPQLRHMQAWPRPWHWAGCPSRLLFPCRTPCLGPHTRGLPGAWAFIGTKPTIYTRPPARALDSHPRSPAWIPTRPVPTQPCLYPSPSLHTRSAQVLTAGARRSPRAPTCCRATNQPAAKSFCFKHPGPPLPDSCSVHGRTPHQVPLLPVFAGASRPRAAPPTPLGSPEPALGDPGTPSALLMVCLP